MPHGYHPAPSTTPPRNQRGQPVGLALVRRQLVVHTSFDSTTATRCMLATNCGAPGCRTLSHVSSNCGLNRHPPVESTVCYGMPCHPNAQTRQSTPIGISVEGRPQQFVNSVFAHHRWPRARKLASRFTFPIVATLPPARRSTWIMLQSGYDSRGKGEDEFNENPKCASRFSERKSTHCRRALASKGHTQT